MATGRPWGTYPWRYLGPIQDDTKTLSATKKNTHTHTGEALGKREGEGGRERGREGEREGGREGEREGGREGGSPQNSKPGLFADRATSRGSGQVRVTRTDP